MTCEMTCFCAVSLSGLLAKTAFGDNASLELADPCLAHFLEHPTATCPRLMIHAGQKFPHFFGIGRMWMLNKLRLELVPQKNIRENDLGHPKRLGDLLDSHALSCHLLDGEKFLCRAHLCARTMLVNTWYLTQMWLWCIDWCHESVLCVDVKGAKVCCVVSYFISWSIFHQKGPKTNMNIFYFRPPISTLRFLGTKFSRQMPTTVKTGAQNAKRLKQVCHLVSFFVEARCSRCDVDVCGVHGVNSGVVEMRCRWTRDRVEHGT